MTVYEKFETMEKFMRAAFVQVGVPEDDAAVCAAVLIESDKRGIESHGVGRFKPFYLDRIKNGTLNPVTRMELIKDGPTVTVIDGHDGMGHVIGVRGMEAAIRKASTYGMGMTAVRNSSHYGIAGYYAGMAAKHGMIGITGTNARPSVAPTFGVENMLGTNPLTVGIPTDEPFDFILDGATSLSQRGKLEVYDRAGKDIPEGWVIDREGNTRTEINGLLDALAAGGLVLTPLGGAGDSHAGYKGYGYATVVEILSAALQGGAFLKALSGVGADGSAQPCHIGHFFIAIDVRAFTELDVFKKTTGDILRALRASAKAPGQDRIYTAGEKEFLYYEANKDRGVPLNDKLRDMLNDVAAQYGLAGYAF